MRRTLLTCQRLVPLANAIGLGTESFDVFQVGLWVEKPLRLRWRSHKHGRCWLLYNRGAGWMWARIWRWCLLPWRPQNSYLKEHRPHSEGKKYLVHVLRKKIMWTLSSLENPTGRLTCCPYGLPPGAGVPTIGATPWFITPVIQNAMSQLKALVDMTEKLLSDKKLCHLQCKPRDLSAVESLWIGILCTQCRM